MPEIDFEAEVEQAKEDFELEETLSGRSHRIDTIELFTDEVTGDKHLNNESKIEAYKLILQAADVEGLEIDDETKAGLAVAKKDNARLLKEQPKLLAELHKTSLILELRSTPRIAKEAAQRHAFKVSGAKPGNIQPEQITPFNDAYAAYIISKMVMGYTNNRTGTHSSTMTLKGAQLLREHLPEAQYKRLEDVIEDLQNKNAISEAVTASPDFSQAG